MPGAETQETWTSRRLIRWMSDYFSQREVESPRVVAEMLLAHVLGCDRTRLYMEADRPASADELGRLRDLTARAARHEPVHYLIGEAPFYWRQFEVNNSTLIPQPSTEVLVEAVIEWARSQDRDAPLTIADIATGTGCIAISLAAHIRGARVVASDISAEALELSRRNAARHGVEGRIQFLQGTTWEPFQAGGQTAFDVICSNPPYVPDAEVSAMDASVREHVAPAAWRGGADGLDVIRPILALAADYLRPGGLLALECAASHAEQARDIARSDDRLDQVELHRDQDGLLRTLLAIRQSGSS